MPEIKPSSKTEFKPSNTNPEATFHKFATDCSDVIAAYQRTKRVLYRGIGYGAPDIFIGKPRNDRIPLDTPRDVHDEFNNILTSNGFIATRENSIFCVSKAQVATSYGNAYMIFPKNGFAFTWAKKVSDLTNHFQMTNIRLPDDFYHTLGGKVLKRSVEKILSKLERDIWSFGRENPEIKEYVTFIGTLVGDFFDKEKPQKQIIQQMIPYIIDIKTNTNKNIVDPKELMVLDTFAKETVSDEEKQLIGMKYLNDLGFDHTNFDAALMSSNEICISGKYYAFSIEDSNKIRAFKMLKALGIK